MTCNLLFSSFTCHRAPRTCSRLQMTTSTKFGQNFDRSILIDKNATCLSKTEAFSHFAFLTLHVFPLPALKEIQLKLLTRFLCCDVLCIWVLVEESVATLDSSMAGFVRTFMQGFYSRVTEKAKAFLP